MENRASSIDLHADWLNDDDTHPPSSVANGQPVITENFSNKEPVQELPVANNQLEPVNLSPIIEHPFDHRQFSYFHPGSSSSYALGQPVITANVSNKKHAKQIQVATHQLGAVTPYNPVRRALLVAGKENKRPRLDEGIIC